MVFRLTAPVIMVVLASTAVGCRRPQRTGEGDGGSAGDPPVGENSAGATRARPGPDGPKLGATALQVNVYGRPDGTSKRLGYLRLGTEVGRDEQPAGRAGCSGGWYRIEPRGFVCTGDDATIDVNHPLLRAAPLRPDTTKALPYHYVFVRAVAPLYLRVPIANEQYAAEFKLADHLDWWKRHEGDVNRVNLGANDVLIDERGVPLPHSDLKLASAPGRKVSTDLSLGELLGGQTDDDPLPFWLEGGRKVPNVSEFKVPPSSYFANRVRRHTGLAVVGSFRAGSDSLDRRFAITTDLRLVPASKIKPDTASPFHGVELTQEVTLPVAFVQTECVQDGPCARAWRLSGEGVHHEQRTYEWRTFVRLSGQTQRIGGSLYRQAADGAWLKASDLAVISAPAEWPAAAQNGQKWVDISIENQTLALWEGKKPVYVTLVSTGQDGLLDPKITKSTVTGSFRIKSKHVTATMDSNERSSQGGGPAPSVPGPERDTKEPKEPQDTSAMSGKPRAAPADSAGRQVRRGEGLFELRDVPYVQYFEAGYALHAAYWHDVFGKARSHGCVNLSPIDAHRLFDWTDPPVPEGWHGIVSQQEGDGTVVYIHK